MSFSNTAGVESEEWFETAIRILHLDLTYITSKMNQENQRLKKEVRLADQAVESLRQELTEAHEIIETLRDSLDKLQDQG